MTSIYQILLLILGIAKLFIFAHFIMSWLLAFNVLNPRQPLVQQIWMGLSRLLEPLYRPFRKVLPATGGVDWSPFLLLVTIGVLRIILTSVVAPV